MKTIRAFGKMVEREAAYEIVVADKVAEICHAGIEDALRTILLEGWTPLDEWTDADLENYIGNIDPENLECDVL